MTSFPPVEAPLVARVRSAVEDLRGAEQFAEDDLQQVAIARVADRRQGLDRALLRAAESGISKARLRELCGFKRGSDGIDKALARARKCETGRSSIAEELGDVRGSYIAAAVAAFERFAQARHEASFYVDFAFGCGVPKSTLECEIGSAEDAEYLLRFDRSLRGGTDG